MARSRGASSRPALLFVQGGPAGAQLRRINGLRVIACRTMTLDDLEKHGTPAIVFISTIPSVRHALLYLGSAADSIETMDPDRGHMFVPRQRFREVLYGKALLLAK